MVDGGYDDGCKDVGGAAGAERIARGKAEENKEAWDVTIHFTNVKSTFLAHGE